MPDTQADALSKIAGQASNVEQLTKSMESLTKATKEFMKAGDIKGTLGTTQMIKDVKKLIKAEEDYIEVQKDIADAVDKNIDLTEDQLKKAKKASAVLAKASQKHLANENELLRTNEKLLKQNEAFEADALKNFRNHTKTGKAYSALTGKVSQFVSGLTLAAMATKALSRYLKAAEVRQNILIQSYSKLSTASAKTTSSFGDTASQAIDTASQIETMNKSMAMAEGHAIRLGVSTEYVGDSMQKFARITGNSTPKVLETLTKGAISVSRTLGISVPEAVDFVSMRMDKFGGSAAGAIKSLNDIQNESVDVNKAWGRTVIRGDDVVRTLADISRQTSMYAIDQRFVGGILRDNISRLQATGDSYDLANRKAQAFAKAVTGEAPEWMKILSGQKITSDFMSTFGDGGPEAVKRFTAKFGAELDAAKPGLNKQIMDILADKTMGSFSKNVLIQELTSGTTIGMESMNKQILRLASNPQGIALIAEQFGVTKTEAWGMVQQAKAMDVQNKKIAASAGKTAAVMAKELDISKETAQNLIDQNKTVSGQKNAIRALLRDKEKEKALEKDIARVKTDAKLRTDQREAQTKKIALIESQMIDAQKKGEFDRLDALRILKKEAEAAKERLEEKETADTSVTEGLSTVEEINKKHVALFKGYSDSTGNSFTAMLNEMSTGKNLLILGGVVSILALLNRHFGFARRFEMKLATTLGRANKPIVSTIQSTSQRIINAITKGGIGRSGRGDSSTTTTSGGGGKEKGKGAIVDAAKKPSRLKRAADVLKSPGMKKFGKFAGIAALIAGAGALLYSGTSKAADNEEGKEGEEGRKPVPIPENTPAESGMGGLATTALAMGGGLAMMGGMGFGRGGEEEEGAGTAVTTTTKKASVSKSGSIFSKLTDKLGTLTSKIGGIKGVSGVGKMLSPVGKVVGMLGKGLGKLGGLPGLLITALFELPKLIGLALAGKFKEMLLELIPLILGGIGAALGTLIGGPMGTMLGGIGGGMLGNTIKDWLGSSDEEKDKKKKDEDEIKKKEESSKSTDMLSSAAQTLGTSAIAMQASSNSLKNIKSPTNAIEIQAPPTTVKPDVSTALTGATVASITTPEAKTTLTGVSQIDMANATNVDELVDKPQPTQQVASSSKDMTGAFQGGVNPDGSITLRVDNFMQAFSSASSLAKRGTIRQANA